MKKLFLGSILVVSGVSAQQPLFPNNLTDDQKQQIKAIAQLEIDSRTLQTTTLKMFQLQNSTGTYTTQYGDLITQGPVAQANILTAYQNAYNNVQNDIAAFPTPIPVLSPTQLGGSLEPVPSGTPPPATATTN